MLTFSLDRIQARFVRRCLCLLATYADDETFLALRVMIRSLHRAGVGQ